MWQTILLKIGVSLVFGYIKSTETKKDDEILKLFDSCGNYIHKDNNCDHKKQSVIDFL